MSRDAIEVSLLCDPTAAQLEPLLHQSAFKPSRFLARELADRLDTFWFSSIEQILLGASNRGFAAVQEGVIVGILVYAENPWETKMLGAKAGVINHFVVASSTPNKQIIAGELLASALQHASGHDVKFMLSKCFTDDMTSIHALEHHGFRLMDTVVDCFFDYRRTNFGLVAPPRADSEARFRVAELGDREALVGVARLAFQTHFGRFHSDNQIDSATATRIYEEWIHGSLDGYADRIDLAEIAEEIVGFSIWKAPNELERNLGVRIGHYSISGIHPRYHGRGLFTSLTYEGMKQLQGVVDVIEGPTHINNYGVQAGYQRLGWRVCGDARHSFHKWLA